MSYILKVNNLSYARERRNILHNINFAVNRGEIINIIGPNGAGKTSLMEIICGLQKSYIGSINLAKKTKINYLPQKIYLNHDFPITVLDFFKLFTFVNEDLLNHVSEVFGIKALYKNLLNELSGGELQKIYLVRSLACDANLLMLDEPIQYLDVDGQLKFYLLIEEICKKYHKSALIISHDINVVMKSSQKVICLNKHICCQGHVSEVQTNVDFNKLFGEKLDMVIAPYKHNHDHTH